jgi:hypothetical protein
MPAMKTDDYFKRRIHTAQLQRHNGTQDTLGQPTYEGAGRFPLIRRTF